MDRYIGMDVHAMSCTLTIVGPSGRQLKSDVVETNGQASVFKAPSRFARLRALATSYDQITRDVTRTQTRIKALFRGRGIQTQGQLVYSPARRAPWLAKLPEA
ncbi:MAG: hypothetical protein ABI895_19565, partial [Deltaproteobacteria bacterium]